MIMRGRAIAPGCAEGEALVLNEPFSFLGGVEGATGKLHVRDGNVAGKVFLFPKGKGSTVGSFVMYDLMVHGKAPAAVVNRTAETIVTTGAVIASIPLVDGIDVALVRDGDHLVVDGTRGYVELKGVQFIETVSAAILVDGKVLMLHRPTGARSFPDRWSLVSGKLERGETPEEAARREVKEETQLEVGLPDAAGTPLLIREQQTVWKIWPLLYRLKAARPVLNHENTQFAWVDPAAAGDRCTVDGLAAVLKELLG